MIFKVKVSTSNYNHNSYMINGYNCNLIESFNIFKYFDIVLNSKLKCDTHIINSVIGILRKFFYVFKDVKSCFNIKMIKKK